MLRNAGFSLIELMITVAVIAILMAIAIPAYQIFVVRSQVAGALDEITAGKSSFESELISNSIVTTTPEDIGLKSSTLRCATTVDSSPDGFIRCTMKGSPIVNGKALTLRRTLEGSWHCQVDASVPQRYWPNPCS